MMPLAMCFGRAIDLVCKSGHAIVQSGEHELSLLINNTLNRARQMADQGILKSDTDVSFLDSGIIGLSFDTCSHELRFSLDDGIVDVTTKGGQWSRNRDGVKDSELWCGSNHVVELTLWSIAKSTRRGATYHLIFPVKLPAA